MMICAWETHIVLKQSETVCKNASVRVNKELGKTEIEDFEFKDTLHRLEKAVIINLLS
jgi:stress response protein SCP2